MRGSEFKGSRVQGFKSSREQEINHSIIRLFDYSTISHFLIPIFCFLFPVSFSQAATFEKIAFVDNFDFATICDIEKKSGNEFMLDVMRNVGATAVAWRQQSGGNLRYRSEANRHPTAEMGVSKLRIPDSRNGYGWLNLDRGEVDLLQHQFEITAADGRVPAVHFTLEENHYYSFTFSSWTLEHPEYWCVMNGGLPWPGHVSFTYPESIEHRLVLLDEVIDRGAKLIYLGLERNAGYGPRFEYTKPSIAAWKAKYDCEPPRDCKDARWVKHCGVYYERAIRAMAKRCRERGVRVILGTRDVGFSYDELIDQYGVDWPKLCAEGIVDGVCPHYVDPHDKAFGKDVDVWTAIDRIYAKVVALKGKADVYFSCNGYGGKSGFPALSKETGLAKGECARRLLELAKKHGGKGVILEVVDHDNYPADVCKVLREFE